MPRFNPAHLTDKSKPKNREQDRTLKVSEALKKAQAAKEANNAKV